MSLDHHIVTPLTAMVVENEAGDERMLADAPPQDQSCCSGGSACPRERRRRPAAAPRARVPRPPMALPPARGSEKFKAGDEHRHAPAY